MESCQRMMDDLLPEDGRNVVCEGTTVKFEERRETRKSSVQERKLVPIHWLGGEGKTAVP